MFTTLKEFAKKHSAFTESSLRHLIFNEHENGLADSGAISRVGRRIYINEQKWFDWIENHGKQS